MDTDTLLQNNRTVRAPFIVIAVTTLAATAISFYCLSSGYVIIFQNLFYIPIILASMYYDRKGFVFSAVLSFIYLFLIIAFTRDLAVIIQALVRVLIFVVIAGITTFLSIKRKLAEDALCESEQKYRMIAENTNDLIWILDLDAMQLTYASPSVKKVTGYTVEEHLNRAFEDIVTPQSLKLAMEVLSEGLKRNANREGDQDVTDRTEWQAYHKDGHLIWMEVETNFIRDDHGKPIGIIGVSRDISERKNNEKALKDIEERYKSIFDRSLNIIYLYDLQGNFIDANKAALELIGCDIQELTTLNFQSFLSPDQIPEATATMQRIIEHGFSDKLHNYKVRSRKGDVKYIEARGVLLHQDNQPYAIQGIALDVTERKKAEVELKNRNRFIETILDNLPIGLAVHRISETITVIYMNKKFEEIYGWTKEQIKDVDAFFEKVYPGKKEVKERVMADIASGDPSRMKWAGLKATGSNGEQKIISAMNIPLIDQDLMISTVQDITEGKRAEEAIRDSEEKYRNLVENISDVIYEFNSDGVLIYISPVVEKLLGYSPADFIGKNFLELVHKDDHDLMMEKYSGLRKGIIYPSEFRFISKFGEIRWVRTNTKPIIESDGFKGARGMLIDITEIKRAEEEKAELEAQLGQSQKMESLGTLAGGVAHEFNNILAIIIGNTELAVDNVSESNPARKCLEEILSTSLRAKDVVSKILGFARKSVFQLMPVQISPIISETLKLIRASAPKTIEIRQNLSCTSDLVMADATQITQVLMNLCANATKAMQEKGGVLEVKLENCMLDEKNARLYENLSPGNYLKLTVRDTGCGIDPKNMGRIFDPYFTTSSMADAAGMGLAVVHGIVKHHNGAITSASEPSKGSIFEVLFPLTENQAKAGNEKPPALPGGKGKILFVDDDASLVKMAKRMLEIHGYQVETKSNSVEALEMIRFKPYGFDLVITDMTMPKMTGDRLAKEILKIHPDMPIILCSGFNENIDADKAKILGIRRHIEKPMNMSDFVAAVRSVIDESKMDN